MRADGKRPREDVDIVPSRPDAILALSGATIRVSNSVWRLSAECSIDWTNVQRLPSPVHDALRAFMVDQITRNSPRYVQVQYSQLTYLTQGAVLSSVDDSLANSAVLDRSVYQAFAIEVAKKISAEHESAYRAAFIRFYLWCADFEFPGFDADVAADLDTIVIQGAPTGQAVMRQDPNEGPLNETEYQLLQARLRSQAADSLSLDDSVITLLFLCFGCNPKNVRLMLEEDLLRTDLSDGSIAYEIRIPRIKKRTAGERDQFRTRHLDPYVGRLVEKLIERNRTERPLDRDDGSFARPLIPTRIVRRTLIGTEFERHTYRLGQGETIGALDRVAEHLDLRTVEGLPMRLTPRRLRYIFATKLVASGASPQEVADALDHTDSSHVMVYFNTRSDVVRRLDMTMGMALAPIAQAFMGMVIRSEADADRRDDKASRIRHASPTMQSLQTLGSCGSFGFCGLHAPIACYTCTSFQAWLDGPHEAVFSELEALRIGRMDRGSDTRITQIHDRTMLAVAEVIRRCALLRKAQ